MHFSAVSQKIINLGVFWPQKIYLPIIFNVTINSGAELA